MINSKEYFLHSLQAISPIDGRHRCMTEPLANWFSEFALFKYRVYLEIEYLIALSDLDEFKTLRKFTLEEKEFLRKLVTGFSLEDAQIIQDIDRFGYQNRKPINHDVKAVEYFIKIKLEKSSLKDVVEIVHYGLTSEDVNNIAHNCMLRGGLNFWYIPSLVQLLDNLKQIAENEKETPLLARTHGQSAVPTTFGKEMAIYLERLRKELIKLSSFKLPAKLNGSVGNYNALYFANPEIDWIKFTEQFILYLGFEPNLLTTQIEPHDGLIHVFNILISINNILRDLSVDFWLYILQGYLVQKNISTEVGSSVMAHKINPWRLEVAEGSSVEANAKLTGFVGKLQSSRLQRDCSDHEAQRAIGIGVAHSYLVVLHLNEELGRIQVNRSRMKEDLLDQGEILTEAVQTILRKDNYAQPYELMKDFSRGKSCTVEQLYSFIDHLDINPETKKRIKGLKPENYVGLTSRLTDLALARWNQFRNSYQPPILPIKKIIFDYSSCFGLKLTEDEEQLLIQLKNNGLTIFAVNGDNYLFQSLALDDIKAEKGVMFVGKYNSFLLELKQKGLIWVNYDPHGKSDSEYNIFKLSELPFLINSFINQKV